MHSPKFETLYQSAKLKGLEVVVTVDGKPSERAMMILVQTGEGKVVESEKVKPKESVDTTAHRILKRMEKEKLI